MRQLSNALLLAQQNDDRTPYVRVYLNSVAYTTADRVLAVTQSEKPYEDSAEILLDNSDANFKASDLIGYEVNLGFGMGNEYSNVADLYVTKQEDMSINGKLYTRLTCMGNWGRLEKHKVMGDSIGAAPSTLTDTIKEIIDGTGAGGTMLVGSMALDPKTSDGTEITKAPELKFEVGDSKGYVIRVANNLTKNLLFMRDGDMIMIERNSSQQHRLTGTLTGELTAGETVTGSVSSATGEVVYQSVASGAGYLVIEAETGTWQTSENAAGGTYACNSISAIDQYDYLYELDGAHTFFEHVRTQSLLRANRIICVDKLPDTDGVHHTHHGVANNLGDQSIFGITTYVFEDSSVVDDSEAATSAAAMLDSFEAEASGGAIIAPMNCGVEMYDLVKITDSRGGWTGADVVSARVGGITRKFESGIYNIKLLFGGLTWMRPPIIEPEDVVEEEKEEIKEWVIEEAPTEQKSGWKIEEPMKMVSPEALAKLGPGTLSHMKDFVFSKPPEHIERYGPGVTKHLFAPQMQKLITEQPHLQETLQRISETDNWDEVLERLGPGALPYKRDEQYTKLGPAPEGPTAWEAPSDELIEDAKEFFEAERKRKAAEAKKKRLASLMGFLKGIR